MAKSLTNCNIWFASDFHYGHVNICRGVSKWPDKEITARDFETMDQMNYRIVKNINDTVMQDDILYFLGDWSMGGIENIWNFRKQIYCKTIHFITGNHDQTVKKNKILPNCYWVMDERPMITHSYIRDGELPKELSLDAVFCRAQSLFTSVQDYLELVLDGQIFVLSHYPLEEWFEMDRKGAIMLHGHCHHKLDDVETNYIYRRMDVGLDWKEFRPFSLEEVVRKMSKRPHKTHKS